MYGIFTYIWVIFRANVGKYTIHGAYGWWFAHQKWWFSTSQTVLTGDDQRDQTGSNPHFFKRHVFGWIGTTPSCSSKTSGADMGPGDQVPYPLVNIQKTMERSTMLLMGKLTISTGPFSIAMLVITFVCWYQFPMVRYPLKCAIWQPLAMEKPFNRCSSFGFLTYKAQITKVFLDGLEKASRRCIYMISHICDCSILMCMYIYIYTIGIFCCVHFIHWYI